jgi:hypothetical protein
MHAGHFANVPYTTLEFIRSLGRLTRVYLSRHQSWVSARKPWMNQYIYELFFTVTWCLIDVLETEYIMLCRWVVLTHRTLTVESDMSEIAPATSYLYICIHMIYYDI